MYIVWWDKQEQTHDDKTSIRRNFIFIKLLYLHPTLYSKITYHQQFHVPISIFYFQDWMHVASILNFGKLQNCHHQWEVP